MLARGGAWAVRESRVDGAGGAAACVAIFGVWLRNSVWFMDGWISTLECFANTIYNTIHVISAKSAYFFL